MFEFLGWFGNGGLFYRLHAKVVDIQALMKYYDVDGDGNITYDEFLSGLKDELTGRRKAMVDKAFIILDKDGSGKLTVSDIRGIYDVTAHKDFIEGTKTKDEIIE